jgi:pyruvate/2-oxoglutarate dehydrogenase complex dihydrolipoamide dehydrogenase (E3) component
LASRWCARRAFVDARTVEADGVKYTARRIVVATGSRAATPPIPGLADVPYLTNESIFENQVLPSHLIIIGGGPIGMEMAQAHRRLGAQVTVIEAFDPLAKDDPELTAVVLEKLKSEGIAIMARAGIASIASVPEGIAVTTKDHGIITGSHLLVAAGRQPNIEGSISKPQASPIPRRASPSARASRPSNPKVYAVGDVAGGLQFTHVAGYHAGLVIRNALFGLPVKADAVIPWVTYTDPELAHVGLTEAQAREAHGANVKVLRWPFHENDRAQAEGRSEGLVKVITGKRGKILGASIVGSQAGELIHPWVQAITKGFKIGAMVTPVAPYPTRGEANRRAAITYFADFASNVWVRRAIRIVSTLRP